MHSPWILAGLLGAKLRVEEPETSTIMAQNVIAARTVRVSFGGLCKEEARHVALILVEMQRRVLPAKL